MDRDALWMFVGVDERVESVRTKVTNAGVGETRTVVALPDFHYEGGLQPHVDLYDKDLMADLESWPTA
ncbi:hypothetical protein [Ruania rhizosphaerae]|uniref:hypothetical protein n=1 Tax=Ruania rhizosphaerae TaxID=1840413 RepID=UPI001359263C|nr:hypothetical protein [Ruania rhizosphaerae]